MATSVGNVPMMTLLLDAGAEINYPNKDGLSPLGFACYNGDVPAVNLLLNRGADTSQVDVVSFIEYSAQVQRGTKLIVVNGRQGRYLHKLQLGMGDLKLYRFWGNLRLEERCVL